MSKPRKTRAQRIAIKQLSAADMTLHDANVSLHRSRRVSARAVRAILEARQIILDAISFVEQN